jgi:CHASE2 domain-containing sensor protein
MVSQILSAVENRRSLLWFSPLWGDALWIWAWSMVGGIIGWQFLSSPLRLGLSSGVAIITLNGICFIVLLTNGGLLPVVPSALALVGTGGIVLAYKAFRNQPLQSILLQV